MFHGSKLTPFIVKANVYKLFHALFCRRTDLSIPISTPIQAKLYLN